MSSSRFCLRWGIVGPGRIAHKFAEDLLSGKDSRIRESFVEGVEHKLAAIASSTAIVSAQRLRDSLNLKEEESCSVYGSYAELFADSEVDIVYIATPNHTHYRLTCESLESGKHALVEKPFTVNQYQAKKLFQMAKDKNLFLMEAIWTKFNPVVRELRDLCFEKDAIGDIYRISSDASYLFEQSDPAMERVYNLGMGGGVLLDIGIYSLMWPMVFLASNPKRSTKEMPEVTSACIKAGSGVDVSIIVTLTFGELNAISNSTACAFFNSGSVKIEGSAGSIEINSAVRPTMFKVFDSENNLVLERDFAIEGVGMYYEADDIASCIRQGSIESTIHSWEHTLAMAKVMDTVRMQHGIAFGEESEST